MDVPLTVAAAVAALIWAYLLLGRGHFWQLRRMMAPSGSPDLGAARIAIIMPARNEAQVIAASISALVEQSGEAVRIFLVDDASTDGTAQIAREAASRAGKSAFLTVIPATPLPPGWSGKLWAVCQGIVAAREFNPDFLLLTDADVVHSPSTLTGLVALADTGGYDLVSYMVKLHCQSVAEKLLIPAFVFFFFKLYPPNWIADAKHATAGAAGGCLLVRPAALARSGGIEAIRGEIIDDCALARAVKRSGGRLWLGLTNTSASIRPYRSFGEIGRMISRTAFNQLRHSLLLLLGTAIGLSVIYVLPPALVFSKVAWAVALGAMTWAAMIAAYLPMIRFYGLNPFWALTLPMAALFFMGATIHSAVKFWLGKGGEWKGRAQDSTQHTVSTAEH